ncbi:hypothetical protein [Bombilactobacillus bombi]|nr:hypothetical protein [Bombilactobacillus bombi]
MELNGFDELSEKLNKLQENAEKLSKNNSIEFDKLFTKSFMTTHTSFSSIDELLKSAGIHNNEEFEKYPSDKFDLFIKSNTNFNSWDDMLDSATSLFVKNQLGF